MLFFVLSLPACTFYTVTNKSQQDLQIETANDVIDLKADHCIELTEYFLGLAGDFPFVIVGEKNEQNPGHYEITAVKPVSSGEPTANTGETTTTQAEKPYKLTLSEKNPECSKKPDNGEDKGDSKPSSAEIETKNWTEDPNTKAFCLSGKPACSGVTGALVKCIKEAGAVSPAPTCVQEEKTVKSATLSCSETQVAGTKPKCLSPVEVQIGSGQPLCGDGVLAQCAEKGARAICGQVPGDTQNKAYCVNTNNIHWSSSFTCANKNTPTCGIPTS